MGLLLNPGGKRGGEKNTNPFHHDGASQGEQNGEWLNPRQSVKRKEREEKVGGVNKTPSS